MDQLTPAPLDLSNIVLGFGAHPGEAGNCLMEAVSLLAGEEKSDYPKCTAVQLASLGITINDSFRYNDNERTKLLVPVIPFLLNTSSPIRRDAPSRFPSGDDPHEIAIGKWLAEQSKKRLLPLMSNNFHALDEDEKNDIETVVEFSRQEKYCSEQNRIKVLTEATAILKEGAVYAKQLLGKDVHHPVTIYASEGILPALGDNYVDDLTDAPTTDIHVTT